MSPSTALAIVPRRRFEDLEALYDAAVAYGANDTRASREVESAHDAVEMLAFALNRIPDIAICAHAIETHGVRSDAVFVPLASGISRRVAGALRLVHRAAEIDARRVEYSTAAWREQAILHAGAVIDLAAEKEAVAFSAVDQTRLATVSLTRALVAANRDRLALPGHISEVTGSLLALYALADMLVF